MTEEAAFFKVAFGAAFLLAMLLFGAVPAALLLRRIVALRFVGADDESHEVVGARRARANANRGLRAVCIWGVSCVSVMKTSFCEVKSQVNRSHFRCASTKQI